MLYTVNGRRIRSENAAKPVSQPCRWVLAWIEQLPPTAAVLDYGCGKFRYTIPLAAAVSSVTAVDSQRQVGREQLIAGERATLHKYAEKYLPNVAVEVESSQRWKRRRYDFILLTNVLSAIPNRSTRIQLLTLLRRTLNRSGRLLVVTQFADSYFSGYEHSPRASRYRDGWLINGRFGTSFYGTIDLDSLRRHCLDADLEVIEHGVIRRGKSAYVIAGR